MTSHETRLLRLVGAAAACAAVAIGSIGCESSPPPPPVVTTLAPPPPPPKPTVTPIDQLMVQLGIDERVQLLEEDAPAKEDDRRAVLEFFDTFARSDATALGTMLSMLDRLELEDLVRSGAWEKTTSQITRIHVQTGESPDGQACALAIFYVGLGHQPQLWYYTTSIDGATFDAVATPPNIMDKLSGSDWIAAWFELLEQELALAYKPDEEFVVPQKIVSGKRGGSGSSVTPGGAPASPTGTPGGPGRRPPPRNPRRPPGPPG